MFIQGNKAQYCTADEQTQRMLKTHKGQVRGRYDALMS